MFDYITYIYINQWRLSGSKTGSAGPESSTNGGTWHKIEGIIPEFLFNRHKSFYFWKVTSLESVL